MAEGSDSPEQQKPSITPTIEVGSGTKRTRQAIPTQELNTMNRREAITKGALTIGGIAAATASLFGLGKAFEKAWTSKEPSIEQGKEVGAQAQSARQRKQETGEQPTPKPTPPLWERTAVPAGQEPTPGPKLDPSKIKGT